MSRESNPDNSEASDLHKDSILKREIADVTRMLHEKDKDKPNMADTALKMESAPATASAETGQTNGTDKKDMHNSTSEVKAENGTVQDVKPAVTTPCTSSAKNVKAAGMKPGQNMSTMEGNFVQQQSQIFVFSTSLANKASEAVMNGQYKSILAFHMDQPGTKETLQKMPMKMNQFGPSGMPIYTMAEMQGGTPSTMQSSNPMLPANSMVPNSQWMQQPHNSSPIGPPNLNNMSMSGEYLNPDFCPPSSGPGMGPWGGQSAIGSLQQMAQANQNFANMHSNLSQSKVPNENLTPEQLQRREEHLASLRKIQQMLGLEQSNAAASSQAQNMQGMQGAMYSHQSMMAQQSMMSQQQGMMTTQQNMMMQQQTVSMQNAEGLPSKAAAQREWMRLQQQFYMEKRRYQQMQMQEMYGQPGGQPGPPGQPGMNFPPNSAQGPPPSYYSSISQRRQGMPPLSPTSSPALPGGPMQSPDPAVGMMPGGPMPGGMMPGGQVPGGPMPSPHPGGPMPSPHPGGPMPSPHHSGPIPSPHHVGPMMSPHPGGPALTSPHGHMSPVPDGQGHFMFPGPGPGGIGPRHPMPDQMFGPQGPPPPGNSLEMMGNMGQNFGPGMGPMMRQPNPPKNANVMIGKVGNPEQFQITSPPPVSSVSGPPKPPPSYAQSTKRKRERDDFEDLYKNLQPTPSPQQMNYMNQYEGQELTITKQLNTAYQGPPDSPAQKQARSDQYPHNQNIHSPLQSIASPMSGPVQSSKGGQRSRHGSLPGTPTMSTAAPLPSPISSTGQSSQAQSIQSPMPASEAISSPRSVTSGGRRLSHFDPPPVSSSPAGATPTSTTSSSKSTMSNITSASLANLAKGVEHLSNQMQQNMMQGGPFHNIQIQSQMTSVQESASTNQGGSVGGSTSSNTAGHPPLPDHLNQGQIPQGSCGTSQQTPSVNNTYVNATMSIQQLNIQNVTTPGNYPTMQVQQMNNDMNQMTMSMAPTMPHSSVAMTATSVSEKHPFMSTMEGDPTHRPFPEAAGGPFMDSGQDFGPMGRQNPGPFPGGHPHTPQGPGQFFDSPPGMGNFPGGQQGMMGRFPPTNHQSASMVMGSFPNGMPQNSSGHFQGPGGHFPGQPESMGSYPGPRGPPFPGGPGDRPQQTPPGYRAPGPPPQGMGNANVKIQAKAPNTIQYLPANPPAQSNPSAHIRAGAPGGPTPDQQHFDMMQRFSNPLANMDSKVPSSKLSYFPDGPQDQGFPLMSRGGGRAMQGQHMGMMGMMPGNPGPGGDMPPFGPNGPGPQPGMGMPPGNQVMHSPPLAGPGGMGPGSGMPMGMPGGPPGGSSGMPPGWSPSPRMGSQDFGMLGPPNGGNPNYNNANFHQFQQQLYAQNRPRQMPPPNMAGNMPNQPYMNMMPNMP